MLGDGQLLEYDQPQVLLKNQESEFTKLVNDMKNADGGLAAVGEEVREEGQ